MKKILNIIRTVIHNIKGGYEGWRMVHTAEKDMIYTFYGYGHFRFAKRYADLRKERNGKRHWVMPVGRGADGLVVLNISEKKMLQRLGKINKHVTVNMMLNEAYYRTPMAGEAENKEKPKLKRK